jgi:hypothetical protein
VGSVRIGGVDEAGRYLGFGIQIAGFATIAFALELGGAIGQSGVPFGAILLGLGVAVSSSQQVSILQSWARSTTIGKVGALRQAVIGLTTAMTCRWSDTWST